uniref:N-acetylgalactosaminide beta-1,3-galactosyltransferase n=1 Tax=Rhabditophanes sp. KR3021 TaxID=114890 RepID=A0AC35TWZ8_9BILA
MKRFFIVAFFIKSHKFNSAYKFVADQLRKSVKIFCIILTTPKYKYKRVIPQLNTWVPRGCADYMYASSKVDPSINAIKAFPKDGYFNSYGKVRGAIIKAYEKHGDKFDWYIKADDDTYLVMENLRMFLLNKNASQHQYHGFKLHIKNDPIGPNPLVYHHGGASYVMSRHTIKELVTNGFGKKCQHHPQGADDRIIGRCLMKMKLKIPDARDKYNRVLFMPSTPINFATQIRNEKYDKYNALNYKKFKKGKKGISEWPIAFHHMTANLMYGVDYLLYTANVMGISQRVVAVELRDENNEEKVLKKIKQFSKNYFPN